MENGSSLNIQLESEIKIPVTIMQPVVSEVSISEIKITAIRANYLTNPDGSDGRQLFVRINGKPENILVAEGSECQEFEDLISPLLTAKLKAKLTPELISKLI